MQGDSMTTPDQQAEREARRLERLSQLLSSVPHVRKAAEYFNEAACERATAAAREGDNANN